MVAVEEDSIQRLTEAPANGMFFRIQNFINDLVWA
jgi:hypothetical protein